MSFCYCDETELHFALVCPRFTDLKEKPIPPKFDKFPNHFRFSVPMAINDPDITLHFAIYFYKGSERKNKSLFV